MLSFSFPESMKKCLIIWNLMENDWRRRWWCIPCSGITTYFRITITSMIKQRVTLQLLRSGKISWVLSNAASGFLIFLYLEKFIIIFSCCRIYQTSLCAAYLALCALFPVEHQSLAMLSMAWYWGGWLSWNWVMVPVADLAVHHLGLVK